MAIPKAPTKLITSIDETELFVVLHWDKVTKDIDDTATTVTSYKVYRAQKSNLKDLTVISTVTTLDIDGDVDTICVDSAVNLTVNNYYQITAVNGDGESMPSTLGFDLIKLEQI